MIVRRCAHEKAKIANLEITVNFRKLSLWNWYCRQFINIDSSNILWISSVLFTLCKFASDLSRLKIVWMDKNISLASKVKLMRTLILSTFLYACESWTLTAEIERRIQALEMRCYKRLLNISYKDHVTNEEVRNRIQNANGVHDDLLTMIKKRNSDN